MGMHLDDDVIATMADGIQPGTHRDAIAHLGTCAECRNRLAEVTRLLDDPSIKAEVEEIDPATRPAVKRWPPAHWAAVATLAAAASIAIVLLGPGRFVLRNTGSPAAPDIRREGTLTTAAPPRILSPIDVAGAKDSLRWTPVTGADLYRIQIWNREGTVVWSTETKTTSLPIPPKLIQDGGSYLWEVKARTGWDRWVASDFLEFTVRPTSAR
jgi:hypothetical protein